MQVIGRAGKLVAVVVTAFGLIGAGAASAATFTVNDTTDAALAMSTNQSCVSTHSGSCTLRAAVQAADNTGGASAITLPAGTYTLTIPPAGSDDPSTGDLDIDSKANGTSVTITGAGSTIINANHIDRAFAVDSGGALSISGVTVENGATTETTTDTVPGQGGAFYNDGSLSVDSSVLRANSAGEGGGVVQADTGASSTSITNSTLTQNASNSDGGVVHALAGSIVLAGDTIAHDATSNDGGAVWADESGPTAGGVTVSSTAVSDTSAGGPGGALYLQGTGTVMISDSQLSGDTSGVDGGAIFADATGLTVTGSTFDDDSAAGGGGGAIATTEADISVGLSTFSDDDAADGGAILLEGSSATANESITQSSFVSDQASAEGGAVSDTQGDLTITQSALLDNSAGSDGGGLGYVSADGLALTNDTFDGNESGIDGGGIYFGQAASTGSIALLNDTVAHNTSYSGGGIFQPADANSVQNTIVAGNAGNTSSASDCSTSAGAADIGGNLDGDGSCFSDAVPGDQTAVDPLLGQPADNGGSTETDALAPGSPAIGRAIALACPAVDQRGVARGASCDVGAFQTATATLSLAQSGPASATPNVPFTYAITGSDGGPGPSSDTVVVDRLPANSTLYGASASQGSCTSSGSPATVTCELGVLASGSNAMVTLVLAVSQPGPVSDTATVSNAEGSSATASATTQITAPPVPPPPPVMSAPSATTGGAGHVTKSAAKLVGQVGTGNQATWYFFQYGKTKSYGLITQLVRLPASAGVSAKIGKLAAGTKYHYRLVAINDTGSSFGADRTFKTAKPKKKRKR